MLRCRIEQSVALTDPAKGWNCRHPACFNYTALYRFVTRKRLPGHRCPHPMCSTILKAPRDLVRDGWLRGELEKLAQLPEPPAAVWLHGQKLEVDAPAAMRESEVVELDNDEARAEVIEIEDEEEHDGVSDLAERRSSEMDGMDDGVRL